MSAQRELLGIEICAPDGAFAGEGARGPLDLALLLKVSAGQRLPLKIHLRGHLRQFPDSRPFNTAIPILAAS